MMSWSCRRLASAAITSSSVLRQAANKSGKSRWIHTSTQRISGRNQNQLLDHAENVLGSPSMQAPRCPLSRRSPTFTPS